MVLSQGPCSSPHISINGAVLQSVDKFCYLGSTVDNTNSLKSELDIRIGKASTTSSQLRPRVWSSGNLSIRVKSRCTWPVLSVCYSVVVKRGQHTGTKNAVLTLFTCVVSALSRGCPGRTVSPIPQHCKRLVFTTS